MKDNNLENQLRDKLGSRSITPSANAWERLSHNRQQPKKGNKKSVIYYVAASIVFLLVGGYAFLMNTHTEADTVTPVIVNTVDKPTAPAKKAVVPQPTEAVALHALPVKEDIVKQTGVSASGTRAILPVLETATPNVSVHSAGEVAVAKTIISQKNISKHDIYEAEANRLLERSLNDIALQRQVSAPTDDSSLLKEVETEMDDYYRSKAMKIFALKHKTIRFAVNKQ
jgi:hypothetical protein